MKLIIMYNICKVLVFGVDSTYIQMQIGYNDYYDSIDFLYIQQQAQFEHSLTFI